MSRPKRKIVIFADGTGNTVDQHDSNVLRLCRMVDAAGKSDQWVVYDPGVGTTTSGEVLDRALPEVPRRHVVRTDANRGTWERRLRWPLGSMFGLGTAGKIRELYQELSRLYTPGDDIYLFGFSRGAFTVRALAGLIYRCGIPRGGGDAQIDAALRLGRTHFEACRSTEALQALKHKCEQFKRDAAHVCDVRFLGVWDTVKSVGYLWPRNPPHTRHNPIVRTVRHALSIGEKRSFYAATTWGGLDLDTRPAIYAPTHPAGEPPSAPQWQDVQEVWFAGNHSDVGGGYASRALADVSLHWMLTEAMAAGLCVDPVSHEALVAAIRPVSSRDMHDEMTRTLLGRIGWWISECCPRRDIENEPPPPRLSMPWPKILGPRRLAPTARRGVVTIHSSARDCYEPRAAPWTGTRHAFIDTARRKG